MAKLARGVLEGNRVAVSKAITSVENHDAEYNSLLKEIFPHTGRAFVIGVTGPPGTGKSSMVDRLLEIYLSRRKKVAVLAVDPTSPVSGGAILGDRVRMLSHTLDNGAYIRSMASRGDEGGLSKGARNAVRILDAAGYDIVLLETVGTGQAEVEVVKVADAVVVVLMPELGDEVQAIKAGLMEIGDIFAVNKSDLPGADRVLYNLLPVLSDKSGWHQIALKVSSKTGEGISELASKLEELRSFCEKSHISSEKKILDAKGELLQNVSSAISERVKAKLDSSKELGKLSRKMADRKTDPEEATRLLLDKFTLNVRNGNRERIEQERPKIRARDRR